MNIRVTAAKILHDVVVHQQSLTYSVENYSKTIDVSQRPLLLELTYGTLRWYYQLKAIADLLLHKPLKKSQQLVYFLLLTGLYQLMFMHLPEYAAVSETVMAAKSLKKFWATGLLNKLLRRFIREKQSLLEKIKGDDSARYAHPAWMIEKIQQAWPEKWSEILEANNQQAPMTLRINRLKITPADYLKRLEASGMRGTIINSAIQLQEAARIDQLPDFYEGFCSVQDLSGQYAAQLLDLTSEQRVLDACAAPGSKTCHIMELAPDLSQLIAIDKDPERLKKIKENIDRLFSDHAMIRLILADASHTQTWWDGKLFDRILLDAPCSATGVIRRHPDIKILRREADIDLMQQQQLHLLTTLWPLLKKEGKLLYCTCSILPMENEHVVQKFLRGHPDAASIKIQIPSAITLKYGQQLLPQEMGHDGFYYSLIAKK